MKIDYKKLDWENGWDDYTEHEFGCKPQLKAKKMKLEKDLKYKKPDKFKRIDKREKKEKVSWDL